MSEALDGRRTALDLTVKPLILGTRYADLRELTRGPGLVEGSGDPHPEALQAGSVEEALEVWQDQLGRIPLVVTVAVASPLELALFLTSLRAFVDGTAPGMTEWKRLQPGLDPVEVHRRVFREELVCPGGGSYRWNPEWHTMESSVFGHPGEPRSGIRHPAAWDDLARVAFGLFFEEDGLRVRGELEKK